VWSIRWATLWRSVWAVAAVATGGEGVGTNVGAVCEPLHHVVDAPLSSRRTSCSGTARGCRRRADRIDLRGRRPASLRPARARESECSFSVLRGVTRWYIYKDTRAQDIRMFESTYEKRTFRLAGLSRNRSRTVRCVDQSLTAKTRAPYKTLKYWRPAINRIATIRTSFITQDGTSFRILKPQSIRTTQTPDCYIPRSGFWSWNTSEPSVT
jgi:hypothetical protein